MIYKLNKPLNYKFLIIYHDFIFQNLIYLFEQHYDLNIIIAIDHSL